MIDSLPGCVLFDLDGTIVDSLPGIEFSVREAFSACKLPVPQGTLREFIGPPIRGILSRAGNILEEAQLEALERAFRVSYDMEGWRRSVWYPDADLILRTLRERGHRLFVVSNKPWRACHRILEDKQILNCFEAIVTRDSRSPNYETKEEMVTSLLTESVRREDAVMVGDTSEDAKAAAEAGIPFLFMRHGYGSLTEISKIGIAQTLDSFSQFYELMNQEPALD